MLKIDIRGTQNEPRFVLSKHDDSAKYMLSLSLVDPENIHFNNDFLQDNCRELQLVKVTDNPEPWGKELVETILYIIGRQVKEEGKVIMFTTFQKKCYDSLSSKLLDNNKDDLRNIGIPMLEAGMNMRFIWDESYSSSIDVIHAVFDFMIYEFDTSLMSKGS
jgi:hypothetical protein